jgi:hypothetical protein
MPLAANVGLQRFRTRSNKRVANSLDLDGKVSLSGPVAQLDRASVFGTEGWGFDSLRGRHLLCVFSRYQA